MSKRIKKRKEDEADKWLREHDPYYTDKTRDKGKRDKYPYLTPDQELQQNRKEIPISSFKDVDLDYLSLIHG